MSYLGFITDWRFRRKIHLTSIEYSVLLKNGCLTKVVSKRLLTIKTLVEDNSHTPNIHFTGYFRGLFTNYKALWGEVPTIIHI